MTATDDGSIDLLVVEDSRLQAKVLKDLLQRHGYRVAVAFDGRQALELAQAHRPRLIISDIVMPLMDGYEMCHEIKTNPQLRYIVVVLLITLADTADVVRGLEAQADSYLTKPYHEDYLIAKVAELLEAPPPVDEMEERAVMSMAIGGKEYIITAGRRQMMNLLFSTYENAIQQNRELLDTQLALQSLNRSLMEQKQQIETQQDALQEANTKLHELATRDGLTGLINQRAFRASLQEETRRAVRYGTSLSVLMLDVDHFKQYNDAFGHPAGDEVLQTVGRLLQETARTTDIVARYGGEEFVVVLPATATADAIMTGERFRRAVSDGPWTCRPITVSVGAASCSDNGCTESALITAADKALYLSKSAGRNRVTHASTLDP